MAVLLNAAFNRMIHSEAEYWNFVTHSPSFRHDLNLIAEAPDGSFAAHVGVTYEDANQSCVFEPVCTHPAHQRKGLARALMLEGLRRARSLGAVDAYVGTGDGMAANYLYEAVGFTEVYHGFVWRKVW
jgi:GNAT superfamily N-acetyltransferase